MSYQSQHLRQIRGSQSINRGSSNGGTYLPEGETRGTPNSQSKPHAIITDPSMPRLPPPNKSAPWTCIRCCKIGHGKRDCLARRDSSGVLILLNTTTNNDKMDAPINRGAGKIRGADNTLLNRLQIGVITAGVRLHSLEINEK